MRVKRTIQRDLRDDVEVAARFWAKVSAGDPSQCWPWRGATSAPRRGPAYGKITVDRVTHYAHRVVWVMTYGPIPDGRSVLHRCDNPPCCNPAHLFLGTHSDNMQDRETKGRHNAPRGEAHAEAKLTEQEVLQIRALWRRREKTAAQIGAEFGISGTSVRRVATYKAWVHVP